MKKISKKLENMKLNRKFTITILIFVMIPMGVILGVLFYNMEQSTIKEHRTYMKNKMERNKTQMETGISSINMATQFFISDAGVLDMLNASVSEKTYSSAEMKKTYDTDIAALERLIYNNPLLYGVRVYATNDKVLEMMPVLYQNSRMKKLSWAKEHEIEGWHFGYSDTIFEQNLQEETPLLCYVTKVKDYRNGTVGYVEAAMKMDTMFYEMYAGNEKEWTCFMAEDGTLYMGNSNSKERRALAQKLYERTQDKKESVVLYEKVNGRNLIGVYQPVAGMGGALLAVEDITEDVQAVYRSRNITVALLVLLLIGLSFFINWLVKHLLRRLYGILKTVHQVQEGDLDVRISVDSSEEMGELGAQLNTMLDRIQTLMQENLDRQLLVKNSQIRALQNQINAHFIYNVLETIKMMAEIDEKYVISDAVTSLGKMLRYSMKWTNGTVLLEEELEYVRNYVALMNLRFDYEIILSMRVPQEMMQQVIPKMSLQPIVENAIKHGIEDVAEDTTIYIKAEQKGTDCVIEVTDSGKGMTPEQVEKLKEKINGRLKADNTSGNGHGIGLKNVQDRITIAFGNAYGLAIASKEGCYTKVSMHLPQIYGTKEIQGREVRS